MSSEPLSPIPRIFTATSISITMKNSAALDACLSTKSHTGPNYKPVAVIRQSAALKFRRRAAIFKSAVVGARTHSLAILASGPANRQIERMLVLLLGKSRGTVMYWGPACYDFVG